MHIPQNLNLENSYLILKNSYKCLPQLKHSPYKICKILSMVVIYWQRQPPQLAHMSQSTKTHTQTHLFVNIPGQ